MNIRLHWFEHQRPIIEVNISVCTLSEWFDNETGHTLTGKRFFDEKNMLTGGEWLTLRIGPEIWLGSIDDTVPCCSTWFLIKWFGISDGLPNFVICEREPQKKTTFFELSSMFNETFIPVEFCNMRLQRGRPTRCRFQSIIQIENKTYWTALLGNQWFHFFYYMSVTFEFLISDTDSNGEAFY